MKPFKIFDAEKSNLPTRIFGGEASGVRDYDNLKYPTMLDVKNNLFAEYWIEHEIKLGKDIVQYKEKLSNAERYVYNIESGMLNELDSSATDFLDYLSMVITDPSIRSVVALIKSFETLHNGSYQYLTSTMLNEQQKHEAFESVKKIDELLSRNAFVYEKINVFIQKIREYIINDEEVTDDFLQKAFEGILAYQCLEGLHFSSGFVYFHSLARDQKMIGSNNMITLIKSDEAQHSEFFGTLLRMIMAENPQLNTRENMEYAKEFIKTCVANEKKWANHIFQDIDLFGMKEYEDYVEYLSNVVARNAGIEEPFPENKEIKSRWIVTYGSKKRDGKDGKQIVQRQDFLQGNAINYAHEGGEDFDL
ncbi:ribonucleotide-diphosphate reductase subunit beta [Bacillus sp. Wb]